MVVQPMLFISRAFCEFLYIAGKEPEAYQAENKGNDRAIVSMCQACAAQEEQVQCCDRCRNYDHPIYWLCFHNLEQLFEV